MSLAMARRLTCTRSGVRLVTQVLFLQRLTYQVDTALLVKLVDAQYDGSSQTLASSLASRITNGDYSSAAESWISCNTTTETISGSSSLTVGKRTLKEDIHHFLASRAIEPLECPLEWASDSNAINCDFLFTYDQFDDLCSSSYYDDSIPIVCDLSPLTRLIGCADI
jgi:hypothetical protein